MPKPPLVSVITAVFNGQDTLQECLQSVINQKYKNFEWLLVDDQSTDHSFDIISHWQDARIRVSQTASNTGGPAAPRNLAFALSKGDYIAILDQDDLWDYDKLEQQVDFMEKHKDIGLLSSNLRIADYRKKNRKRPGIRKSGLIYPTADDIYRDNPFLSSAIIMRRIAVEDVGGFDEHPELCGMDEWELEIRISLKYKTAFNGNHLAGTYRLHENNLSFSISPAVSMDYVRKKHDHHFSDSLVRDVRARDYYNEARNALISGQMAVYRDQISKAAHYRSFYTWKGIFLKYKFYILKLADRKARRDFSMHPPKEMDNH